jgi:hypothetical protein
MATNLFSRAAAYRKKHPNISQSEAVKLLSKSDKKTAHKKKAAPKKKAAHKKAAPRKKAAVGKAHHKKAAPKKAAAAPKRLKVKKIKVRIKKSGMPVLSIGAVHMNKIHQEHTHQHALQTAITKHAALHKTKGLAAAEKQRIAREIKQYKASLAASKKHVSALKRHI